MKTYVEGKFNQWNDRSELLLFNSTAKLPYWGKL